MSKLQEPQAGQPAARFRRIPRPICDLGPENVTWSRMVKTEEAIGAKDVVLAVAPPKTIIREYFEQGLVTVIMALFLMTHRAGD